VIGQRHAGHLIGAVVVSRSLGQLFEHGPRPVEGRVGSA
jgi:hypothetical protein